MAPEDRDAIKKSVEATKVEYKQLGKCGLRVSVPIFGAMSFGDPSWQPWVLEEEKVSHSTFGPSSVGV